ncbi:hypothetical protein [Quadrisphaera sp. INWT6]|uniref:hypothetical protein n=1 Tax=Quadrisphaera sp. INWT6 TaxID=2596917 RepID=UPI00189225EB|nr:hypothetical protein [Quadrisphaera sp. INWT6]MBF5080495.1 hypothetical protein [Quadrisphaera sp. INWT6]
MAPSRSQGAGALDSASDDLDGLDGLEELDLDTPWEPPPRRPRWRRRWVALAVLGGAAALTGVVVAASSALRTPQERLEDRLAEAVRASGAELASPVELTAGAGGGRSAPGTASEAGDGADVVWTGRLQVVEADGTATVRVALRLPPSEPDEVVPSLFPAVDCDTRYPLTWPGDSDTSYRTTRADLSECVATADGDDVLVTIGWRDDDDGWYGGAGGGDAGGGDRAGVDRQTWRTDGDGGLVWLRSRGAGEGGLTAEQQRAVASAEGLLARL